jgi:protein-S-isoprenylcysteine O-methyltransferase Ste14
MSTNSYLTFLLFGIVLVVIDGQILYRSGVRYLESAYPRESARSVMQLVAVLFHLVVLGVLALISMMTVDTALPIRDLVVKLGVVLLTLGAAHGVTMAIVAGLRARRRDEQLMEEEITTDRASVVARDASVRPSDSSPTRY